jgi:hypothetical protein
MTLRPRPNWASYYPFVEFNEWSWRSIGCFPLTAAVLRGCNEGMVHRMDDYRVGKRIPSVYG